MKVRVYTLNSEYHDHDDISYVRVVLSSDPPETPPISAGKRTLIVIAANVEAIEIDAADDAR